MADERKVVDRTLELTIFTILVVIICVVIPFYFLSNTPSGEVFSTNTMIATLLIMLIIPLLDMIWNFEFLKAYDAENYDNCETNLTLTFLLSFMVGAFVLSYRALRG